MQKQQIIKDQKRIQLNTTFEIGARVFVARDRGPRCCPLPISTVAAKPLITRRNRKFLRFHKCNAKDLDRIGFPPVSNDKVRSDLL